MAQGSVHSEIEYTIANLNKLLPNTSTFGAAKHFMTKRVSRIRHWKNESKIQLNSSEIF
jgi:hypothetical protein